MKHLHKQNVNVLPWPSNSADYNPIEHFWDELDRRLRPWKPKSTFQCLEGRVVSHSTCFNASSHCPNACHRRVRKFWQLPAVTHPTESLVSPEVTISRFCDNVRWDKYINKFSYISLVIEFVTFLFKPWHAENLLLWSLFHVKRFFCWTVHIWNNQSEHDVDAVLWTTSMNRLDITSETT